VIHAEAGRLRLPWTVLLFCCFAALAIAQEPPPAPPVVLNVGGTTVTIPRISSQPSISHFLAMKPDKTLDGKLAVVSNFLQRDPKNDQPAISRTDVYLAYDEKNFYAIFICFDNDPKSIRARLARRDSIGPEDDEVQVYLDTFNDHQRSYGFLINPRGVQFDYLWTEAQGYDTSFDQLWYSDGRVTSTGWIGWIAVPFKSIRFPKTPQQTWGLLLQRVIPRTNENLFWPRNSHSISGRLTQEGKATGLADISPGRNLQFIPYIFGQSFTAPDLRDPASPHFGGARLRGRAGLDAKAVIKDSFVLDATVNPDFSQVESDEPQVTTNQRFEVFFPEKRPFFLENTDFFTTPLNLVFTRRISAPTFGLRLTGKKGPYSIGTLFADDRSPGLVVPDADPLRGTRAYFGILRAKRDIGKESNIGILYTQRSYEDGANRVGGIDGRFKWKEHWTFDHQTVFSWDRPTGATAELGGRATQLFFDYTGLHLQANTMYRDNTENFITRTGFFQRPDIRRWSNDFNYTFRPGGFIVSHGPEIFTEQIWDHTGLRLTENANFYYRVSLPRSTVIGAMFAAGHEQLRPKDFPALVTNRDLRFGQQGVFLDTFWLKQLSLSGQYFFGTDFNFVAADGLPVVVRSNTVSLTATVKPVPQLTIDNTYLLTRLREHTADSAVFNDHIARTKWNFQFTRELSLRWIGQYNSLLPNYVTTNLSTQRNLNMDLLVIYLVHPGTAVYVGYNTNFANPSPVNIHPGNEDVFRNDARGMFVKASYLFRF
jgi:hypothetical protein